MRTFIGIDLPTEWARALSQACNVFRGDRGEWARCRWVPAENLHITLNFLGELESGEVDALTEELTSVCEKRMPIYLPLVDPVVPVRSMARATMMWTVFGDPQGTCADLVAAIATVAAGYGVAPETRPYVPHVTLVRTRRPSCVDERLRADASSAIRSALREANPSVSVREITVYSSTLTRAGATYQRRARVMLGSR